MPTVNWLTGDQALLQPPATTELEPLAAPFAALAASLAAFFSASFSASFCFFSSRSESEKVKKG